MAYTEAQWNKFQASLPLEDRTSYLDYIKEVDPVKYSQIVSSVLENLKTAELKSGTPITKIVDEGSKIAGAKADKTAQKTSSAATVSQADATRAALAKLTGNQTLTEAEKGLLGLKGSLTNTTVAAEDNKGYYTTIVGNTGKTQAQIDAATNAVQVAQLIGGTVDPKTGYVVAPTGPTGPTVTATGTLTATGTATATGTLNATGTATATSTLTVTPTLTGTLTSTGTLTATSTLNATSTLGSTSTLSATGTGATGTTATGTGASGTGASGSTLTYTATDGTVFTDQSAYVQYQKMLNDGNMAKKATDAAASAERQSAYDLLYAEFSKYGLGSLVEPLRGLIQSGASPAEFAIKLRESDAYRKRFSANQTRINKGLKAISEAEYIGLEDQYQNIMRNYGLPDTYWKRGDLGVQEGFTNFIANDVSASELEDRIATAQQRLIYANPEVSIALKNFYPDIKNGDLLAYALDPEKGLEQIKRRITAAEIGSSAVQLGLATNVTDAEYLARYGVNKAQAQQGYRTAADILPTANKLGEIYANQGLGPYTQQTAEQEIFNVPGAAEAAAKRKKLTGLEQAQFAGKSGTSQGALARERAGSF